MLLLHFVFIFSDIRSAISLCESAVEKYVTVWHSSNVNQSGFKTLGKSELICEGNFCQ